MSDTGGVPRKVLWDCLWSGQNTPSALWGWDVPGKGRASAHPSLAVWLRSQQRVHPGCSYGPSMAVSVPQTSRPSWALQLRGAEGVRVHRTGTEPWAPPLRCTVAWKRISTPSLLFMEAPEASPPPGVLGTRLPAGKETSKQRAWLAPPALYLWIPGHACPQSEQTAHPAEAPPKAQFYRSVCV